MSLRRWGILAAWGALGVCLIFLALTPGAWASPKQSSLRQTVPPPTPPPPRPEPCVRSDIDVIVWGKIPVKVDMYIAGALYHTKRTAVNAAGEQQATFTIWPGEGEIWDTTITPRLPSDLDPDEWTFDLIEGSLTMPILQCEKRKVILQLVNVGPRLSASPLLTLPVKE